MKRAVARAWAKYLERPDISQAQSVLERADGSRCCLGHLCAMLGVERKVWARGTIIEYDGCNRYLPESVRTQVGMKTDQGGYTTDTGTVTSLAADNDSGVSLRDIAKVIRKYWKQL